MWRITFSVQQQPTQKVRSKGLFKKQKKGSNPWDSISTGRREKVKVQQLVRVKPRPTTGKNSSVISVTSGVSKGKGERDQQGKR